MKSFSGKRIFLPSLLDLRTFLGPKPLYPGFAHFSGYGAWKDLIDFNKGWFRSLALFCLCSGRPLPTVALFGKRCFSFLHAHILISRQLPLPLFYVLWKAKELLLSWSAPVLVKLTNPNLLVIIKMHFYWHAYRNREHYKIKVSYTQRCSCGSLQKAPLDWSLPAKKLLSVDPWMSPRCQS